MADLDPIDPVTFLSGSTHNALIFHCRKKKKKMRRQHRAADAAPEEEYLKVPPLFKETFATEPPANSNIETKS